MAGDPPAPPIEAICCPGRGAIQHNLLELSIGEEPDPIPRWREERRLGVLGACQGRDRALIQQEGVEAHISPETDFEWRNRSAADISNCQCSPGHQKWDFEMACRVVFADLGVQNG